jgi:hypothetical protein
MDCTRRNRYPVLLTLIVFLLSVGWMCSLQAMMMSCKFVYATIDKSVGDLPETLEIYLPTSSRRGLGFFTWELENGKCSYALGDKLTDALVDSYMDFLGRDWRAPRGFGTTAAFLSYFSFFPLLSTFIVQFLVPTRTFSAEIGERRTALAYLPRSFRGVPCPLAAWPMVTRNCAEMCATPLQRSVLSYW